MRYAILLCLLALLQPANALTVNLDHARIKTIGGIQQGAWNIWSNGEWGDYFQFKSPGAYQIDVEVKGSPAMGVGPMMTVTVDGEAMASLEIKTTELKVFSFPLTLEAGPHRITLQYSNDAKTDTEDRNLYVKSMTLKSTGGQPDPALASDSDWLTEWAKQQALKDKAALEQADADIETSRKENAVVTVKDASGQPVTGASVKVELIRNEFLFGCNILNFDSIGTPAENEEYKRRFADLFNFATTGFYWSDYEKERGKPNYAHTDKVVAWCKEHGIRIKGHPLLWGNKAGIAPWIQGLPTPDEQRQRVTDIIGRYRGQIEFWEVVNEPSEFPLLKIDDPYRWAHETDPQAHLIVNDFNVMSNGNPQFYALLQQAIANNIPFNGIGIQAHEPENMGFSPPSIRKKLNQYGQLGKDLYITEFTPGSTGQPFVSEIGMPTGKVWDEQTQADYAVNFYTMCFANPAIKGITWWDLCDRVSWRKNGGLLRADLTPKPVYAALTKLIHEKWTTKEQGQTDAAGTFNFRGFRGAYAITVECNGKSTRQEFTLAQKGPNTVQITLR